MISDWLAYMLSGELAVDPSNAGTMGLLDLKTRDWNPSLLQMAGLRSDILSPVKETGTQLGKVTVQAAEQCGLKVGTPVVVGGGMCNWDVSVLVLFVRRKRQFLGDILAASSEFTRANC